MALPADRVAGHDGRRPLLRDVRSRTDRSRRGGAPEPLGHRCARRSDRRPRRARGALVAGTHDRRRRLLGPAISPGVGRGAAADQMVRVRVAPVADRGAARVPRRRRDARSVGGRGLLLPVLRDLRGRHPRRGRRRPAPVPPVRPRPRREEGRGVRHPRRVALPDRHGRRRRGLRARVRALRRRAGDDRPRRRDDRRGPAAALRSRPADRRPRRLRWPGEPVRGPRRLHAADGGVLRGRRRPPADGRDPPRSGGRDDRSRVAGRGGRAAARGRRPRRRARAGGAAGATRCAAADPRRGRVRGPPPGRSARRPVRGDAGERPDEHVQGAVDPGPRGAGGAGPAERPADRGPARLPPAHRRRAGRTGAQARARHPRRRPAAARGPRRAAPPRDLDDRAGPGVGDGEAHRARRRGRPGARGPAGPRARHLPAAAGRPGSRRGDRVPGPEGGGPGPGPCRRRRPLRSGGRGERLLLHARGAEQRREVRAARPPSRSTSRSPTAG